VGFRHASVAKSSTPDQCESATNTDACYFVTRLENSTEGAARLLGSNAIRRNRGTTPSEQYLARLAERTFLSLWSYPSVYRDQRWSRGAGDGKEVCDLLVVFENHVIIFSDKHVEYKVHADPKVAWRRWFRAAVQESAQQIVGAERWIRSHSDRLFVDASCKQRFPVPLPKPDLLHFHRLIVTHGASEACRRALGGSGSLTIAPSLKGTDHFLDADDPTPRLSDHRNARLARPFAIGDISPGKGFIHVLDDTTLDTLLGTLDTVTDFLEYLTRKGELYCERKTRIRNWRREFAGTLSAIYRC
jgi:hypothetical protein